MRTYKRKTDNGTYSKEDMEAAIQDALAGKPIRKAAKEHGLNYNTLNRKLKKLNGEKEVPEGMVLTCDNTKNRVFPLQLEDELAGYVQERSELGFGMDTSEVRELAFQLAEANDLKVPKGWKESKSAGKEWFLSFMKRNSRLSLRTPQQCSISRAMAFNKVNITNYFNKLEPVLKRNPLFESGQRTFNCDEVGTTTVGAISSKIVAPKGIRQVHQVRTHERGETVTSLIYVCANGTFLPPVMLYPRKNTNSGFLKDAYPNTLTLASGKKGYMNDEMMKPAILHFIKYSDSSKENPSLLILDNFGSHLTLEVINICKENGVTLFTLPPHTTHRTQPLDVALFGPFKKAYNNAVHVWGSSNPGKSTSIYEVAGFVNHAMCQALTPQNIASAFRATGICPFNPNIFSDSDFVKSSVTFQPEPEKDGDGTSQTGHSDNAENVNNVNEGEIDVNEEDVDDPLPLPSPRTLGSPSPVPSTASKSTQGHVTPQDIVPLPKAIPVAPKRKGRKKGRCMVATDTPEKLALEKEADEKKQKKQEQMQRKALREQKKKEATKRKSATKPKNGKRPRTARMLSFDEDSSSDDDHVSLASKSSSEWIEEEEEQPVESDTLPPLCRDPEEGEYVLVEFKAKEPTYYIGKILTGIDKNQEFEISYLRKSSKVLGKFVLPQVPDLSNVSRGDIKMILPKPTYSGTKRQQNHLDFAVDLSMLKMR